MNYKSLLTKKIIFILIALVSLILFSGKFSVIILFLGFLAISKKIVKTNDGVFYISVSIGVLAVIFFHWYWETFFGNSYFLGRKSDDWQYDELWTKGFIESYNLNFLKLKDHLNDVKSGLGILHNSKGYVVFVILLRWFSEFFDGYHTLLPRVANIFFLGYTAHYASLISSYYNKNMKLKKTVFLTTFFFPVMLFNSVHVFRDTMISFILVFVYYALLNARYSIITIIKVILAMGILFYFRSSTFFVAVLMISICYLNPKRINLKLGVSVIIFSLIAIILMEQLIFNLIREVSEYDELNVERFGNVGSNIFALPLYIGAIPRIIYLIFTPVPNFSGFHQLYQSISAVLQVLFFPYLFVGLLKKGIVEFRLKIVFMLFFLGVAFSTATFRHVTMYLPFGIILTISTYAYYKASNQEFKNYLGYLLLLILSFCFSLGIAFII